MITDVIFTALQNQITVERTNAAVYSQLAIEMERAFWPGFAKFLRVEAENETGHAQKIIDYLTDQDRYPMLDALPACACPSSPLEAFAAAYDLELTTQAKINDLYNAARDFGDFATENLLDFFIVEQVQSVKEFQQLTAEIIRADVTYLKLLDQQLGGE